MPTVHKLSARNQRRTRNLSARAQEDVRQIVKRGAEGGPAPVRSLLRLEARVVGIGLIKANLDNKGHHEFAIEAALKCGSRELSIRKLSHVVATAEYALQPHALYTHYQDMFYDFLKKHQPSDASWQFHVVHNMNRSLVHIYLREAA